MTKNKMIASPLSKEEIIKRKNHAEQLVATASLEGTEIDEGLAADIALYVSGALSDSDYKAYIDGKYHDE